MEKPITSTTESQRRQTVNSAVVSHTERPGLSSWTMDTGARVMIEDKGRAFELTIARENKDGSGYSVVLRQSFESLDEAKRHLNL